MDTDEGKRLEPDPDMLRRCFERAPVGMTQSGTDGRFVRVNQTFCDLLGYTAAELMGRSFQELTHPDDLKVERPLLQRVLAGLQPHYTIEKRLRRKAGHFVWVQRSLAVERAEGGGPELQLSVVIDISARKAAEEALQRSSAQLTTAQRVAHIGSWELDLETNTLHWSDEIFRIFEVDPTRFGASYEAFLARIHPEDRVRVDLAYQASVRDRTPYDICHRLALDDGRVKHVRELGETVYAAGGRPLRSVGTVQDITSQRLTELGLRDRELRLSAILTGIHDLVALFELRDDSIRAVELNPRGLERLQSYLPGMTLARALELDFEELARRLAARLPELANLRALFTAVVQDGQSRELELESRPPPAERLHSEVTLTPVPSEHGQPALVLLVSRDVTARRKAERLLRDSLAEKETLLSEVHHRVKNNLQIISSLLSLQTAGVDATTRELLEEARNRIHTMSLVHEQLYRTSDFAAVDLAQHIQSLATMVAQSQLRRDGIGLGFTLSPVSVSLDQAIPLGLVLNELLSNAWKHAFRGRAGGVVKVSCAREGTTVRVEVEDDGVGLPTDQTLEGARSLGFRIVRTLVAQLGASLNIVRAGGTRLTIQVPAPEPIGSHP